MAAAASVQSASSADGSVVAGGMPVRLKDVATVTQGHKEREAIIRLGGQEAVELAIYKEGDANTVATANAIHERLEQIREEVPPQFELTVIEDQSTFIEQATADAKKTPGSGGPVAGSEEE